MRSISPDNHTTPKCFFQTSWAFHILRDGGKDSPFYLFNGNTKVGDKRLIFEVVVDVPGFLLLFNPISEMERKGKEKSQNNIKN